MISLTDISCLPLLNIGACECSILKEKGKIMNKLELQKTAVLVRKGILTGIYNAKSGHPGGSLSAADIFTYLYFEEMNVNPDNPKDENRDRFVLSK